MPETTARTALMLEFFDRWGKDYDTLCQAFRDYLAPDCVWENAGLPATHGPQDAIDTILRPARDSKIGMVAMLVDIVNIGEANGVVYSERIDHIIRADGSTVMSVPVVGVTEFTDDNKISRWAEYADPTPFVKLMSEPE